MKRTLINHSSLRQTVSYGALACCLLLPVFSPVFAQRYDRLPAGLSTGKLVPLRGSRNPRIDTLADEGPVEGRERITGLGIRFKPTAEQSAALERFLEDRQNPSSPRYHSWLTPEEFADQFGLGSNDLARVSEWLTSLGLQVDSTARSRTWITFSATAEQVQRVFKTEIHRFHVGGQAGFANVTEAQVPEALEPLIDNLSGLQDLRPAGSHPLKPQVTFLDDSHGLGPGDLATIYNVSPLLGKGFDGAGQKIVVVGASAIDLSDVRTFRDDFELAANDPQVILAPGSADPGKTRFYVESVSDVEIAGASAPKASILYVYSRDPFQAAQYAVDHNLAPVISYSYSTCEKIWMRSDLQAARAVVQQANAQGITWIASSGNTGAAGCETQGQDNAGQSGPWVTVPSAFPEVTAVGGTTFVEGGGDYWTGDHDAVTTVRSYIPETAWNVTSLGQGLQASGGGGSNIFRKPSWQAAPGMANIDARMVPDVSFAAAWDHDPYLTIAQGEVWASGGTSSAAPFFAGVVAIINQYVVSTGVQAGAGLGNINPRLYELFRTHPEVFHDITSGDNVVPCAPGSADCLLNRYGYNAGPGYDPVTGLGSLDVNQFVLNWSAAASASGMTSTFVALTAKPAVVDANGSTILTATVKPVAGAGLPTGTVSFTAGQRALGEASLSDSGGSATATLTLDASQLQPGATTIRASYKGASAYSPSLGTAEVTVTGAASEVVVSANPSPVYQQVPDSDGYAWHYRLQIANVGGLPSVVTQFMIDQADYTDRFVSLFGSSRIPAYGSLTATMHAKITTTPVDHVFTFGGVDSGGTAWQRQTTVSFLSQLGAAEMSLSSSPDTPRPSSQGDPHCSADHPMYQELNLQETSGIAVQLNKFIADGQDLSGDIAHWLGSVRLPAFGLLRANLCWKLDAFPIAREYMVGGIDAGGQAVEAKLAVVFKSGAPNPGMLAVSKKSVELIAASGSVDGTLNITLPDTEKWSVTMLPANQKTRWLTVSPTAGRGPGQVKLTANATGLATGAYTATLVFQSENTVPQMVDVPIVFIAGQQGKAH